MRARYFAIAAVAVLLTATVATPATAAPAYLCPDGNPVIPADKFPLTWNLGKSSSYRDGARTCSYRHKGAVSYRCDGSDRTSLVVIGSKRNYFRPDCDGKTHSLSSKSAYSGSGGPYHVHWHAGGMLHGSYTNGWLRVSN